MDTSEAGRMERDTLGEQSVTADALWGIHTARAQNNFALGGQTLSDWPAFITALARIKVAAALANIDLGAVPAEVGEAIVEAAREVAAGAWREQFPLEVVQGGGGTSTNMNVNEVLANRANELLGAERGSYALVHPNDHVNRSQSTNDVLPTAMGIAAHVVARDTLSALVHLGQRISDVAVEHDGLVHLGRTCLQDAVPMPVASVHRAHVHALARASDQLQSAAERLLGVPIGGTAVGTGLGAPDGYRDRVIGYLRTETELPITAAEDLCDGLASLEPFAALADATAGAGRVVARIAGDLRLLASGPIGGIGEIELPALQPGSSIMPGKVNPVMPELAIQVSYQLAGAAHAVRLAAAAGELEVTPMGPVVTAELLTALQRLGRVALLFAERCISGVKWNKERVAANLRGSLHAAVESAVTAGYDDAARDVYERRVAVPRGANEQVQPSSINEES